MSICRIFNHEILISEDWYFISDYYSEFYLSLSGLNELIMNELIIFQVFLSSLIWINGYWISILEIQLEILKFAQVMCIIILPYQYN